MTGHQRAFGPLLALTMVVAASCTASNVDPEADISITGTVEKADSGPVGGARVALTKEPGFAEVYVMVVSLGLACLSEDFQDACDSARVVETDTEGRFSYSLKGEDTQNAGGLAATMGLSALIPRREGQAEGPGTTIRFQVQTPTTSLDTAIWDPNVILDADQTRAKVTWPDLPASATPDSAGPAAFTVDVSFRTQGSTPVWTIHNATSPVAIDARVLEDTRGDVGVIATSRSIGVSPEEGTKLDVILQSGRYGYTGQAGPPDSRGRPCAVAGADGELDNLSPCPITDGQLTGALIVEECPEGSSPCPTSNTVVIDLEAVKPIDLVVVRGCTHQCTVEVSTDQETWQPFGVGLPGQGTELIGADNAAVAASPRPTRYVKVTTQGPISQLREVSAFDRSREPPAAAPAQGSDQMPGTQEVAESPRSRQVLGWAAAFVVLLTAFLVVAVLRARRQQP